VPRRSRPRVTPTEDWQQISLLVDWPEQLAYELIRPVVLFGFTPAERAQQTAATERTLRRKAHSFDAHGTASLFADFREPGHADRRMLPPPIRQLIVDRKAEYPALTPHELATLCYVASGRRPSAHTIQRVLATGPEPSLATPLGLSRKVDDFQDTGATGGTGLRIKSPPVVARTSLSSKVRESPPPLARCGTLAV